jgi:D-alanyl-D-alanine dipeptidase
MFWRKGFITMLAGSVVAAGGALAVEVAEPEAGKVPQKTVEKKPEEPVLRGSRKDEPLADVALLSPRIAIELRYATKRNLAKRAIYPPDTRCLVRQSVAERLVTAQAWLDEHAAPGTTLKIWDGYRPAWVQRLLWKEVPNKEYLGDPQRIGSLHTWGVCVDATLCDANGRDLKMPTDFDVLTPAAATFYDGTDLAVRKNLHWLQGAMRAGGFMVVRDEWWHFVARDFMAFGPMDVPLALPLKR